MQQAAVTREINVSFYAVNLGIKVATLHSRASRRLPTKLLK